MVGAWKPLGAVTDPRVKRAIDRSRAERERQAERRAEAAKKKQRKQEELKQHLRTKPKDDDDKYQQASKKQKKYNRNYGPNEDIDPTLYAPGSYREEERQNELFKEYNDGYGYQQFRGDLRRWEQKKYDIDNAIWSISGESSPIPLPPLPLGGNPAMVPFAEQVNGRPSRQGW